jgi:hypothetical protein
MCNQDKELCITPKATIEDLQELHSLMVALFLEWMRDPDKYKVKPFHLAVVRQFLKDNGVSKNLGQSKDIKDSLGELAGFDIPFLPEYDQ